MNSSSARVHAHAASSLEVTLPLHGLPPTGSERGPWIAPPHHQFELLRPTIPTIQELFKHNRLTSRHSESRPLNVFIPPAEGELLYSLVRFLRPHATLEIGLANGISAVYIAQALCDNQGGQHLAIDPFQSSDWDAAGLQTLARAHLDAWVTLDERPSHWVLPDLEADLRRIQFAFVDGSHLFDYVMSDFLGIDRILDVGGLIAFDDSDWSSIAKVIRFALTNRRYRVFDVGTVIEPPRVRPRLLSRILRSLAGRCSQLRDLLRSDFVRPLHTMGILGRCVVLQKLEVDSRDSQVPNFVDF